MVSVFRAFFGLLAELFLVHGSRLYMLPDALRPLRLPTHGPARIRGPRVGYVRPEFADLNAPDARGPRISKAASLFTQINSPQRTEGEAERKNVLSRPRSFISSRAMAWSDETSLDSRALGQRLDSEPLQRSTSGPRQSYEAVSSVTRPRGLFAVAALAAITGSFILWRSSGRSSDPCSPTDHRLAPNASSAGVATFTNGVTWHKFCRYPLVNRFMKKGQSDDPGAEDDTTTKIAPQTGAKQAGKGFNLVEYGLEGFLRPQITDYRLVVGDLAACLAVPNFVVSICVRNALYSPEWALATASIGQPVIFAAVEHGGVLALCWSFGALLGRAWQARAVYPSHPKFAPSRFVVSWILAMWLLVMSTEASLFSQGISPLQYGKLGYAADMKLIKTHVDIFLDCTLSFLILGAWRTGFARDSGM